MRSLSIRSWDWKSAVAEGRLWWSLDLREKNTSIYHDFHLRVPTLNMCFAPSYILRFTPAQLCSHAFSYKRHQISDWETFEYRIKQQYKPGNSGKVTAFPGSFRFPDHFAEEVWSAWCCLIHSIPWWESWIATYSTWSKWSNRCSEKKQTSTPRRLEIRHVNVSKCLKAVDFRKQSQILHAHTLWCLTDSTLDQQIPWVKVSYSFLTPW